MFEEYEIVVLVLGLITLTVIVLNRQRLRQLPHRGIFVTAFLLFFVSWIFTNLEAFLWRTVFNLLEHLSQVFGGILLAAWSWEVFGKGEEKQ